jgi:hypothetical protein
MAAYPSVEAVLKREIALGETPSSVTVAIWGDIREIYPKRQKGLNAGNWRQAWHSYIWMVYGEPARDPSVILTAVKDYSAQCQGKIEFTRWVQTVDRFFDELPDRLVNQRDDYPKESSQIIQEHVPELGPCTYPEIVVMKGFIRNVNGFLVTVYPYLSRITKFDLATACSPEITCASLVAKNERKVIAALRLSLGCEGSIWQIVQSGDWGLDVTHVQVAPLLEFEKWPDVWDYTWGEPPSFFNKNPKAPKLAVG